MNADSPEFVELRSLLDALCEESIAPEQLHRLEELLLSSPECEAYYIQFMSLHSDLVRNFGGRTDPVPVEPSRAGPRLSERRRTTRRLLVWAAIGMTGLAAGLLLGIVAWPSRQPIAQAPPASGEPVDGTVAVLLQSYRAEWEESGLPTRPGSPLQPGKLLLKSGSAHIEFYSGAAVVLEGPAEFHLISRTQAYCAHGKLRAVVPTQAQGFTIGSPGLDLVDRGTEFGLEVGGKKTEVHVFQGKVDLYDPAASKSAAPRSELKTGEGVRLDGPGAENPIAANSAAFLTLDELAARSATDTDTRRKEWAEASRHLRQDPSLLVYYSFQSGPPGARTLANETADKTRTHDGAVVGALWATGRWTGRRSLEFKRVSDRVRLTIPGEYASLTMAAWVRVDALPNQNNSLMMADGWDPGAPHWQIGEDGTIILGIKSPPEFDGGPGFRGVHYRAHGALTPDLFGQWVHLAVVHDRNEGRVTHYLDGRAVSEEPIQLDTPLRIGDAQLGNWNAAENRTRHPIRNFNGCMDEFMVFSRPLSAPEVERLYAQGRPPL